MGYIADKLSWQQETGTGKFDDGEIWISKLDADSFAAILTEHSDNLITCYIDRKHLSTIAKANGQTEGEYLSNILPDAAIMRSGDFGEILARSILQEWRETPRFPAERWRNRSTKNDTVRGTDLIGYLYAGDQPANDDLLVLCEVKTRENGGDRQIVQKAYEDVLKDNATRLADTLYLLQHALLRDGMGDEAKKLSRFTKPYEHPYRKRLIACVVHNEGNWNNDYLQALPENHKLDGEFIVMIIKVEDLAKWIDLTYERALQANA